MNELRRGINVLHKMKIVLMETGVVYHIARVTRKYGQNWGIVRQTQKATNTGGGGVRSVKDDRRATKS